MTSAEHDEIAAEPASPLVLGARYRLRERIGEGGMGIVFAGDHLELGTKVAIKMLQPKLAEEKAARARFLREARLAASVEGEHSTRIYDVSTDEANRPYLVMEFLAGETLAARLGRVKKLGLQESATILLQLLDALAEAHAKGLVHRDLKPANLFLAERTGEPIWVKVMDFGISKTVAVEARSAESLPLTEPRTVLGSPEYMSPEQLRSPDEVDRRSDLWACGVVLFQLLSGTMPFGGTTLPDLYARIVGAEPRPLGVDVPAPVGRLVERCLRKVPDERPRNAFDIASVLAPYASESARTLLPRIRAWCKTEDGPSAGDHDRDRQTRRTDRSIGRALLGLGTIAASGALAFAIASMRAPAPTGAAPLTPATSLEGRPAESLLPPNLASPEALTPPPGSALPRPPEPAPAASLSAAPSAKSVKRPPRRPGELDGIDLIP